MWISFQSWWTRVWLRSFSQWVRWQFSPLSPIPVKASANVFTQITDNTNSLTIRGIIIKVRWISTCQQCDTDLFFMLFMTINAGFSNVFFPPKCDQISVLRGVSAIAIDSNQKQSGMTKLDRAGIKKAGGGSFFLVYVSTSNEYVLIFVLILIFADIIAWVPSV